MPKRSPEDILNDIEASDLEEAADKAVAMTEEQRRQALDAASVDVKELHAKADAWRERMVRAEEEQDRPRREGGNGGKGDRATQRRPSRRGQVVLLVAAAAMAAAFLVLVMRPPRTDVATPPPAPSTDARPDAAIDGTSGATLPP
jgi:ferric-dicitrate binding protein FerR (iron transport regulator)